MFLWASTTSFIQKISGDNICNMFTDRTRGSVQITLYDTKYLTKMENGIIHDNSK